MSRLDDSLGCGWQPERLAWVISEGIDPGALPGDVAEHLAGCGACEREVVEGQRLLSALGALAASESVSTQRLGKIDRGVSDEISSGATESVPGFLRALWRWKEVMAVAGVLLAIGIPLLYGEAPTATRGADAPEATHAERDADPMGDLSQEDRAHVAEILAALRADALAHAPSRTDDDPLGGGDEGLWDLVQETDTEAMETFEDTLDDWLEG